PRRDDDAGAGWDGNALDDPRFDEPRSDQPVQEHRHNQGPLAPKQETAEPARLRRLLLRVRRGRAADFFARPA
ncbi:MAG TPA: hypothetical protein VH951_14725, partial [Dehalococcoidia bacterium]